MLIVLSDTYKYGNRKWMLCPTAVWCIFHMVLFCNVSY